MALEGVREAAKEAVARSTVATDLALYRRLAALTGEYLAHIDAEECSLPDLWAKLDDASIAAAQGHLVAAHPPSSAQFNLSNMLPAASSEERVAFLSTLKRNMPLPAFANIRALVGTLASFASCVLENP